MFDQLIYKVLDRIVNTCERLKKCIKDNPLPKACYDEDARSEEVKKWAKNKKQL